MKKVELTPQILRLYVGRLCDLHILYDHATNKEITDFLILKHAENGSVIIPHLRPLSSITEDEARELISIHLGRQSMPGHDNLYDVNYGESTMMDDILGNPSAWLYLLSKGFDLFGLIEAGLAKDATQ